MGGIIAFDPDIVLNEAWIFNINTNTSRQISNMTYPRIYCACSKMNENELMVLGDQGGVRHVEVYNIALDKWTVKSEFWLPRKMTVPVLTIHENRIILFAGSTNLSIWEWFEGIGWKLLEKKLPYGYPNYSGAFTPFFNTYEKPKC